MFRAEKRSGLVRPFEEMKGRRLRADKRETHEKCGSCFQHVSCRDPAFVLLPKPFRGEFKGIRLWQTMTGFFIFID